MLFINDEYLGSETYVGTREEFKTVLAPCFVDWFKNAQDEDDFSNFDEWVELQLDRHLTVADDSDIASYKRITE